MWFFFFFFFFFSPCCNLSSIQELLDAFQIAFGLNVLEIDGYLPILFIHVLGEVWKSGVTWNQWTLFIKIFGPKSWSESVLINGDPHRKTVLCVDIPTSMAHTHFMEWMTVLSAKIFIPRVIWGNFQANHDISDYLVSSHFDSCGASMQTMFKNASYTQGFCAGVKSLPSNRCPPPAKFWDLDMIGYIWDAFDGWAV